jgi:hypothetical protein
MRDCKCKTFIFSILLASAIKVFTITKCKAKLAESEQDVIKLQKKVISLFDELRSIQAE